MIVRFLVPKMAERIVEKEEEFQVNGTNDMICASCSGDDRKYWLLVVFFANDKGIIPEQPLYFLIPHSLHK